MTQGFVPTRAAGLAQLAAFVPLAGQHYAQNRNRDVPEMMTVSRLSPWLRHRIITEDEVVDAVRATHGEEDCLKFVQEVRWRSYWKGWLELRPSVWADYRRGLEAALNRVRAEEGLRQRWESACTGSTGIEGFDDWARELTQTGYLHNHARMWFASIWIFTLRLPWELGADFFLRHLLDGDPASNTLSWRWVGGLQTAGKTYLARPDNISVNSGGRFRPQGLATEAMALAGAPAPAPRPLPEPEKLDPGAPSVLVLHEDDLSPGFILDRGLDLVGTALIAAPEGRSPLVVAPGVVRFVRQAVQAAAELHSARLGVVRPLTEGDTAAAMTAWARELGAAQIVTAYAPVGPTAQRLRDLEQACHDQGMGFVRCLREEDRALWPLATHGFFRFWEATSAA